MRKKSNAPERIAKYTRLKGRHPNPFLKKQRVKSWLFNNWINLLTLLVAIITLVVTIWYGQSQ